MSDNRQYGHYKKYAIPWWRCPILCRNGENTVKTVLTDFNLTTDQRVRKYGSPKLVAIFESMPLEDFQQEYECLYRDELAAFITLDMIQACTPTGDNELPHYKTLDEFIIAYDPGLHGSLYAGYDVGRTNDRGELKILGHYPDGRRILWCKESMKEKEFELQENLISRALTRLPIHRLAIDASGLGMDLGERLRKKYKRKVETCTFTNEFKESIANALWLEMNAVNITLPADRTLQAQIHSIKKIVTAGKHARFDCDRNEKHHADEFWALALANYAIGPGQGRSSQGFYSQYAANKKTGTAKITNPDAIVRRIMRSYTHKP
jgi:phage FluMu gp28-like protein